MGPTIDVLNELERRGLVAQSTPGLAEHLGKPRTIYCGFDPTADSLHIGSLVPLLALRRLRLAGHRPIALVGGATGLVGDPSFKAEERALQPTETILQWTASIRAQVQNFLGAEGGDEVLVVNNLDWFRQIGLLDFLREVGKHFSVSAMIRKDSVRQRVDRDGEGISFAEFSYSLLQAADFAELNRRYQCTVQIGGSDQWGNITGGIDLCRRLNRSEAHALTLPLITKADGSKFGKTETGTVWLDPRRTSPYAFFQFWMSVSDADVFRFMRFFTFLPVEDIAALEQRGPQAAEKRSAQRVLAEEVTSLVHGTAANSAAIRITEALFSGSHRDLTEADFAQLRQDGMPATTLTAIELQLPLTSLLVSAGMAETGKQVKDALTRGAVVINGEACIAADNLQTAEKFAHQKAAFGRYFLARLGKKTFHLFTREA
jgi:tyrosyl-tRNA synthetase